VFLNGAEDIYDPPANVAAASSTMPGALLVSVPGSGHWTLIAPHAGCLIADATAFIDAGGPASAAAWSACTRTIPARLPPFPQAP
jgi:hypothetical protein